MKKMKKLFIALLLLVGINTFSVVSANADEIVPGPHTPLSDNLVSGEHNN